MSHGMKQICSSPSVSSFGSFHVGGHSPSATSHAFPLHHGGAHKIQHTGSHISHHCKSFVSHHGGHKRAPSVHGGSGGKGISVSKHSSFSHGGAHSGLKAHGLFNVNEKETMQHLNDRLATYLQKVSSLEQQNAQLERSIREWYESHQPGAPSDYSSFFRTIQDLQGKISVTTLENARIVLQIDNARLASADFRSKYETEIQLRNSVEADVNGLRRVLEELNRERCDLEIQVQSLQEELQQMKRNQEEEINSLQAQLGARVNVEVDAAPSIDLNRTLSEIREQYESLMEKNLREVETMFRQRTEELNREMASGSEQLQSVQTEVIDLRRNVQTLEIELQSQLSMKSALEGTLAETKATFGSQISQLQGLINNVESQLSQIRSDLERQNHEYKILMDQKTHLEMEIATYKRLLEGHDIHTSGHHIFEGKSGTLQTNLIDCHMPSAGPEEVEHDTGIHRTLKRESLCHAPPHSGSLPDNQVCPECSFEASNTLE